MFPFQRSELLEIGEQQNRRFKAQTVRLTFGFAKYVHLAANAGRQRHNMRFTQRIDWRVGDLRELLAEVIVNNARAAGKHGKWGVIAH
ncbi:Uncharacterised protein [Yersinia enterocolitica]|nr:Uncharacterised protein [Yersinia enterocolitica]